ncbi:MAG: substrate-binding domain-containing protein [Pseudomonadota bacterium]
MNIKTIALCLAAMALGQQAAAQSLPPPLNQEGGQIALVRYLSTGDFMSSYFDGAERQADALGLTVLDFDSLEDADRQASMIDEAISKGVGGIIVQLGDAQSLQEATERAVEAGIPVIATGVDLANPAIPQVEQNDEELARLVLQQAVDDLGESFTAGYVYVSGVEPLDRRDEVWRTFQARFSGIDQIAEWGSLEAPIAQSVSNQTADALRANPGIGMIFAPFDEFARGVNTAVNDAGLSDLVRIYSVDISTSDIQEMTARDSAWVATAATDASLIGEVSVRALAMLMVGEDPGTLVTIPPTLITRQMLVRHDITNIEQLAETEPSFAQTDVATPDWMPIPTR